jgi:hypothetical protein
MDGLVVNEVMSDIGSDNGTAVTAALRYLLK